MKRKVEYVGNGEFQVTLENGVSIFARVSGIKRVAPKPDEKPIPVVAARLQGKLVYVRLSEDQVEELLAAYRQDLENRKRKQIETGATPAMKPILEKIEGLKRQYESLTGAEDEGVRLAIRAQIATLEKELQALCPHLHVEEQTETSYTADARKQIYRIRKCPVCGKIEKTLIHKDPLPNSALWR